MKTKKSLTLILTVLIGTATTTWAGGGNVKPELKTDEAALQRFTDMRFGTLIHWGPALLHNAEVSWSMGNRAEYEKCYQDFKPTKFNADEWASLATAAGMKYAIIVCKHHDGFCNWDTATTSNNIMNTPFHTDTTRAFLDACRKQGLFAGTYLSIADLNFQNCDGMGAQDKLMKAHPELNRPLLEFTKKQCTELIEKYDSRLFWFDGFWHNGWDAKLAAELYAHLKAKAPDMLACRLMVGPRVNGRGTWNRAVNVGDFHSMEGYVGSYLDDAWEMVTSVAYPNYSWQTGLKYKTVPECIQTLAGCASGNGNLLLAFVPDADGAIPEAQWEIARQIGTWLKANGESIYGTHAGPWYPSHWGGSTHKGNLVFLHVFPKASETLGLPACTARVVRARALNGLPVEWKQDAAGRVNLAVPLTGRDPNDTVVELTMDRPFTGMVKERELRSMFEANTAYGKNISEKATLTVSSSSQWNDPAKYSTFFTGERPAGFAFHTAEETNPWAIVDLGSVQRITGLAIVNRADMNQERAATLKVSSSEDGKNWKPVWAAAGAQSRWEIPLTDFHDAGGKQPGELIRYLKLETRPDHPAALHLRRIEVYGFDR